MGPLYSYTCACALDNICLYSAFSLNQHSLQISLYCSYGISYCGTVGICICECHIILLNGRMLPRFIMKICVFSLGWNMRKALRINIVPHFSVELSSTCSYIFLISRRAKITYTKRQFQVFYNHFFNFKTSKLQFHVFIRRDVYPVTLCFSSSHITYLVSATFVTHLLSMVI